MWSGSIQLCGASALPRRQPHVSQPDALRNRCSRNLAYMTKDAVSFATMPTTLRLRALLLLILVLVAGPAKAVDPVLAPSGTLRAAYIVANLAQARLDPATGTVSGVIADIARELGRRADVPVSIIPLPTAAAGSRRGPSRRGRYRVCRTEPRAHRRRALLSDVHAGSAECLRACGFRAPLR